MDTPSSPEQTPTDAPVSDEDAAAGRSTALHHALSRRCAVDGFPALAGDVADFLGGITDEGVQQLLDAVKSVQFERLDHSTPK